MIQVLVVSGSNQETDLSLLKKLAKEADQIWAIDKGANLCARAQLDVFAYVGDHDSVSNEGFEFARAQAKHFFEFNSLKDHTDFELALEKIHAVNDERALDLTITNFWGSRFDHMLSALGALLSYEHLRVHIVEDEFDAWIVRSSDEAQLVLEHQQGKTFSVLSFDDALRISLEGFRWNVREEYFTKLSGRAVSNVILDDKASLRVHEGSALAFLYKNAH
ncbi:MAG: thiamine diphosphokinase [Coriobacteriia bacterium]|nr:thiamine diphosphokinase [Coriobacteriia bacterium]